jgi:hypothetical protein
MSVTAISRQLISGGIRMAIAQSSLNTANRRAAKQIAPTSTAHQTLIPSASMMSGNRDFSSTSPFLEHNTRVTPKRAFWEALATVSIPALAVWTILIYVPTSRANIAYEAAPPIYLTFFLVSLVLMFPIYFYYWKFIRYDPCLGRLALAILSATCGSAWLAIAIHRGWGTAYESILGLVWFVTAAVHFRRWMKPRATLPPGVVTR